MRDITFIIGLPGSGKTTLAESLVKEGVTLIDDFCVVVQAGEAPEVLQNAGDKVVITDPKACLVKPQVILEKLEGWGGPCKVRFIAFENDVEACWNNIKARDDGRRISLTYVKNLAKSYDPKEWGEVVPVYKVDA